MRKRIQKSEFRSQRVFIAYSGFWLLASGSWLLASFLLGQPSLLFELIADG
jgi:hypothetical protein